MKCQGWYIDHLVSSIYERLILPEPRGSIATLGRRSLRRMSSRCQAAVWPSSQWLHLTVMAGCRCVKPGISTSTSCSARATDARIRSASEARTSLSLLSSQSLVSVATCTATDEACEERYRVDTAVWRCCGLFIAVGAAMQGITWSHVSNAGCQATAFIMCSSHRHKYVVPELECTIRK